ncbi:metallophosphoesterase [Mangrovicoccus sp. HB161399]|uniref:metallophosphoesterase n=1 Tax=Mangrovicoccus sp. HB161399 TaxID=2720392 RepID=UPI001551E632|nr:metallophosphoesterase [Mangrovicoccus sp. HB161399]
MRLLRKLFGQAPSRPAARNPEAPLAPEEPFYAIGDIHGCDRLLEQLLRQIREDAAPDIPRVVCVGDYVDRGEDSRAVLERLRRLQAEPDVALTCLAGNHEDMLLHFLDRPEDGASWLRNGGLQTLASFGVGLPAGMSGGALADIRDRLAAAMGPDLVAWLQGLPVHWQSGNVAVVHAAADPDLPLGLQRRDVLLWGHPDFGGQPRADGAWVIHGHVICGQVTRAGGCISIDTGAYATGCLSAVHVSAEGVRCLDTRAQPGRIPA